MIRAQSNTDFEGEDLQWIHRRTGSADLYFVANTKPEFLRRQCMFRITGKTSELWNPETGECFALPGERQDDGRTTAVLQFEPAQSWFVVFRDGPSPSLSKDNPFASGPLIMPVIGANEDHCQHQEPCSVQDYLELSDKPLA